mmetsp:Transcript_3214/g.9808  ORF Transcript_3214/g.9808 Transcript_3214/m.9808 type:complete len:210 (+) Transcript_3214:469-1098(+)
MRTMLLDSEDPHLLQMKSAVWRDERRFREIGTIPQRIPFTSRENSASCPRETRQRTRTCALFQRQMSSVYTRQLKILFGLSPKIRALPYPLPVHRFPPHISHRGELEGHSLSQDRIPLLMRYQHMVWMPRHPLSCPALPCRLPLRYPLQTWSPRCFRPLHLYLSRLRCRLQQSISAARLASSCSGYLHRGCGPRRSSRFPQTHRPLLAP